MTSPFCIFFCKIFIIISKFKQQNSEERVNVLSGLDWRRAFGFFLWYGTTNAEDISTALDLYEESFTQGLVSKLKRWNFITGLLQFLILKSKCIKNPMKGTASYPLTGYQRDGVPENISENFFPSTDNFDVIFLILKLYKNRFIWTLVLNFN